MTLPRMEASVESCIAVRANCEDESGNPDHGQSHVPLDFYGAVFEPGTYHNEVEPVDIAATFASLLRINRPSAAVGHMRLEALKRAGVSNVEGTRK